MIAISVQFVAIFDVAAVAAVAAAVVAAAASSSPSGPIMCATLRKLRAVLPEFKQQTFALIKLQ